MIKALGNAFGQENFIDFFSALGAEGNPLVVKNIIFEEKRVIVEFAYEKSSRVAHPISRSMVRMSSGYISPSDLPSGFHLFLLKTVNFWYSLAAAVCGLVAFSVSTSNSGKEEDEYTFIQNVFGFMFVLPLLYWVLGKGILILFY